jgi:hypothetical protein
MERGVHPCPLQNPEIDLGHDTGLGTVSKVRRPRSRVAEPGNPSPSITINQNLHKDLRCKSWMNGGPCPVVGGIVYES